jgi:hypothetical protein
VYCRFRNSEQRTPWQLLCQRWERGVQSCFRNCDELPLQQRFADVAPAARICEITHPAKASPVQYELSAGWAPALCIPGLCIQVPAPVATRVRSYSLKTRRKRRRLQSATPYAVYSANHKRCLSREKGIVQYRGTVRKRGCGETAAGLRFRCTAAPSRQTDKDCADEL